MADKNTKLKMIGKELRHHLPFTMIGVVLSLVILSLIHFFLIRIVHLTQLPTFERFFHLFHFSHIFLSAIASASIYYRHERHVLKTVLIGSLATLGFCGISDVILPFLGGTLLGVPMRFHLCILEEPAGVLLSNFFGIWAGIVLEVKLCKISYFSHGAHILVSSLASLFYLVSYGIETWYHFLFGIFAVTTIAVVIPCCSSDIVLPLSLASGFHGHEHEDEHTKHKH